MGATRIDLIVKKGGHKIELDFLAPGKSLTEGSDFLGDAPIWIQAAARVQALTQESGALDVEGVESHQIEVQGLARGGRLASFAQAALRVSGPKLFHFSSLVASKAMRARQSKEPGSIGHKLLADGTRTLRRLAANLKWVGGPHVAPSARPEPSAEREAWLFPRLTKVMLHDRSDDMGPKVFCSSLDYAVYVLAHELGHVVQAARGEMKIDKFQGSHLAGADSTRMLGALGLLDVKALWDAPQSFENAASHQLGESYADVFAVLMLGGGDRTKLVEAIDSVFNMRAEHFAPDVERYDTNRGDVYHDTREALCALREHVVSGRKLPCGGNEIHEATMGWAHQGCLRWAATVAASDAGNISRLARERLVKVLPGCEPAQVAALFCKAAAGPSLVNLAGAPAALSLSKIGLWKSAKVRSEPKPWTTSVTKKQSL